MLISIGFFPVFFSLIHSGGVVRVVSVAYTVDHYYISFINQQIIRVSTQ